MTIVVSQPASFSRLTLLEIIRIVCRRIGITAPNAALSSADLQVLQLVAISEEEGQEQAARYPWQTLQNEATFTTVADQEQTNLSEITDGFEYIVNDTIWNRDLRRPVYGPKSQQDWQQAKALQINGPFNSYRVVGDAINFYPNPVAGQTCAFEYISRNWVTTTGGTTDSGTSAVWTSDSDTPKLNDQLIILGTIWRWKQSKGLAYEEDHDKYERRIMDAMGRDASKPKLNMTGAKYDIQPGVFIPAGSWGQ